MKENRDAGPPTKTNPTPDRKSPVTMSHLGFCGICIITYKKIVMLLYSRFKNLCNRKAARTKTTDVVNSIRHTQLHRNSLYSSTRVVF